MADSETVDDLLWSLADHQGSVRDWADLGGGTTTVADHGQYSAFGEVVSQTDSTRDVGYGYTGRVWDADAELYYYRARWYDPAAGRFVSEDPIGFAGGDANVQAYVGNSVSNLNDPTGLLGGPTGGVFPQPPTPQELLEEIVDERYGPKGTNPDPRRREDAKT